MTDGTIIRVLGGFYTVSAGERRVMCRAAGRLRQDGITPRVGDAVSFDEADGEGYITVIHPRKNEITRPLAANIDLLIITVAPKPKPDYMLADKLILQAELLGIKPVI